MTNNALPQAHLLQQQAEWLAPARSRLLRGVGIAHRRRILDLGAGYGAVTAELARRGGGMVAALDRDVAALSQIAGAPCIGADALRLPFAAASFDLVFCQCVLMWVAQAATAVAQIQRVLQPGGVLIALEPDYGGMIEHPPEIATRDLWLAALQRAGAEAHMGRILPGLLSAQGFQVRVNLLDEVTAPSPTRFEFLRALPLAEAEVVRLHHAEKAATALSKTAMPVAHLPFMLVTAVKN